MDPNTPMKDADNELSPTRAHGRVDITADPLASGLATFSDLLARRIESGAFTTEDAVRYTLFYGLCLTGELKPEEIVLESDHRVIRRARVDTWIPSFCGQSYAFEFKYDRPIPSGGNVPRTQKAGQVLKDVFRLATLHDQSKIRSILVYLTAHEMVGYMANPLNGLAELFNLTAGNSIAIDKQFLDTRSSTLRGAAGSIAPCNVRLLLSSSLPRRHELRVYEILPG